MAGIVIEPSEELLELQRTWVRLVGPFTSGAGDATAYVTTPAEPDINQPTMDYVATFLPEQIGAGYNPHVTIGVAPRAHLDSMLEASFEPFTFSPGGVSVYQLGNLGTAARQLQTWGAP